MRIRLLPTEVGLPEGPVDQPATGNPRCIRAEGDQAESPDPEAEAYANVGVTTSLAIGLGQTTGTTLWSRPQSEVGHSLGEVPHLPPVGFPRFP